MLFLFPLGTGTAAISNDVNLDVITSTATPETVRVQPDDGNLEGANLALDPGL